MKVEVENEIKNKDFPALYKSTNPDIEGVYLVTVYQSKEYPGETWYRVIDLDKAVVDEGYVEEDFVQDYQRLSTETRVILVQE